MALLSAELATRPAALWLEALEAASVPCAPIRTMAEVFASAEGAALVESIADPGRGGELRVVSNPLRFDGRRLPMRLAPPTLGADNETVLGS